MPGQLFTVFASFSGAGKSNHHFIHSINFHDLEEVINSDAGAKHEPLTKGSTDLLHEGNKDSDLYKNKSATVLAYNRQLTRYNTLYSKLVT